MSAHAAALPCPVCLHIGAFDTVRALRERLIFVSTNKTVCPVCQEEFVGLDKLTIHLFSHVSITSIAVVGTSHRDKQKAIPQKQQAEQQKQTIPKSNRAAAVSPVTFVSIYPKLPAVVLNTVPLMNSNGPSNPLLVTTLTADSIIDEINNKCNICGVQFINGDILKMHNSIIHNVEDRSTEPTKYKCHLCSKHFKMRGSLMVHLRVAHFGFPQAKRGGDQRPGEVVEGPVKPCELTRSDGKQWQCDVCHKYFTTKYFLKKHKRLHTGETPYSCSQCSKTFTFQQSYHKHLLYHNDDKPHSCSHCGRSFKELSTLHNHQRIHTGEKPFACETCGKSFRQRVSYLVHRRIHTGAMPYQCTTCQRTFRYKVSQRTHKCLPQPPGAIICKSEGFVQELSTAARPPNPSHECQNVQLANNYSDICETNAELIRTGAQISLEDMESENFSIIPEHIAGNLFDLGAASGGLNDQVTNVSLSTEIIDELIDSVSVHDKNIPSPSDILKNLCLSSENEYLDVQD